LSSIVDDSVQFYWDIVSKDTIAEGAELIFRRVPGLLRCQACGHTFSLGGYNGQCPHCGAIRTSIADGDQFKLESIDIEGPQDQS
jgi:hydrogenase nickel incorporation protein HypA/HybF